MIRAALAQAQRTNPDLRTTKVDLALAQGVTAAVAAEVAPTAIQVVAPAATATVTAAMQAPQAKRRKKGK